jgi:hypothetical protein
MWEEQNPHAAAIPPHPTARGGEVVGKVVTS